MDTQHPGEAAFTLRAATTVDLPAILDIYNDAVLHTTASYDEEPSTLDQRAAWFTARAAQGLPVLVAEHAGTIVGFGSYGPFRERTGYRFTVEHSVYVAPPCRQRGIGRAIVARLIEHARLQQMHAMIAIIDAETTASIRLHTSLGFVPVGHFREVGYKFGRWLDLVCMEFLLEQ